MQEADGGGVASGEHRRLGEAVKAGGGGREAAVGYIAGLPVVRIVAAALPVDAMAVGQQGIGLAHADALDAAQLIDRPARGGLFAEAHGIHLADDAQPRRVIQRDLCLPQELVRARAARLSGGIEPHTALADPCDKRSDPGGQDHGGMADAGTRFQHDAGNAADGYLGARAVRVDGHASPILHVQPGMFDEDHRSAILQRDWRRRGKARQVLPRSGHAARRISIRPQPKDLARPKPNGNCTRNAAGSVISIRPARSRIPNWGCPLRGPRWPVSTSVL